MKKYCVKIEKQNAKIMINHLIKKNILDLNYIINQDKNFVYIPLKEKIDGSIIHNFKAYLRPMNYIKLHLKNVNHKNIRYIKFGDSIIFNKNSKITKKIVKIYAEGFGAKNVYVNTGEVMGTLRHPSLKIIYGPGGDVKNVENGVKYFFDPSKIMFSPGNINARTYMKYADVDNKIVMDMFVGIGYFSLPILKYKNPKVLYACDLNPDSIFYLEKNIRENGINREKIKIHTGDSRKICPYIKVDYIILGNFESINFLASALARSKEGTVMSMHYLTPRSASSSVERIIRNGRRLGYILALIKTYRVKTISPQLIHINSLFVVKNIIR